MTPPQPPNADPKDERIAEQKCTCGSIPWLGAIYYDPKCVIHGSSKGKQGKRKTMKTTLIAVIEAELPEGATILSSHIEESIQRNLNQERTLYLLSSEESDDSRRVTGVKLFIQAI